jgi:hypothetical protein
VLLAAVHVVQKQGLEGWGYTAKIGPFPTELVVVAVIFSVVLVLLLLYDRWS